MVKKRKFFFISALFIGLISGYIIGVITLEMLVSYKLDQLYTKIKQLEAMVEDKDVKLKKLEESINKKKYILKNIEIIIISEDDRDEIEKITLENNIKEKYNQLIGNEVKSIDVNLVAEIIDNRIFMIDDREYKLNVQKVLLAETLSLWVKVELMT